MLSRRSAPPPPGSSNSANPFSSYAAISELDRYKLISNIGKGSFGVISKVQRIEDGREFALKQLDYAKMTEKDVKQIIAEVAILESLKHRNIVQLVQKIHDARTERIYIVMEYCTSGDLGTLIRKAKRSNTPISEDKIWNIFVQIVSALHHCHWPNERTLNGNGPGGKVGPGMRVAGDREARYQVLHRDLKPENVFLSDEFVKLGDFGLSKDMGNAMFTQTYVGTPLYMPPEILAENKYDTKSDIWSLGCLVFEMCALESPFSNAQTQAELITMVRSGRLPPIPAIYSPSLRSIVKTMLQIVPSKRPSTHDLLGMEEMKLHKKLITVQNQSALLMSKKEELKAYEESLHRKMAQLDEREVYLSAREAELVTREEACRAKEEEAVETQKRLNTAAEALRAQWEKLREEKAGIGSGVIQEQLAMRRPSIPPQRPPLEERATMPIPSASRPPRPAHAPSYDDTPSKIPVPIYSTPSIVRPGSNAQGSLRRAASKSLGNLAARARAEAAADAERALCTALHGETDATPAKQVLRGHPRGRSSISSPNDLKLNGYWNEDISMASPAISIASPFVPLAPGIRRKSVGLVRGSSAGSIGGLKPSGSSTSQDSVSTTDSGSAVNQQTSYASSSSNSAFSATLPTPAKWSQEDPDLPSPFLRRAPTAPPSYTAPTNSSRERLPLGAINLQPTTTSAGGAGGSAGMKKGPMLIPRSKSGNLHQHVLKQNATQTMNGDKRVGAGERVQARQMRGQ